MLPGLNSLATPVGPDLTEPTPVGPDLTGSSLAGSSLAGSSLAGSSLAGSTRVMLADDHRLLREGLRRALEGAGIPVVAEAGTGQEAVRLAELTNPTVIVMDISMPILDGIGATRAILQRQPGLAIVMLTMFTDPPTLGRVAQAGAVGWLGKDCTTDQIIETVKLAAAGALPRNLSPAPDAPGTAHCLTAREVEVLTLVAEGASTDQLAASLFISPRTVKNHLASIYEKLNARSRTQALVEAARLGVVSLG